MKIFVLAFLLYFIFHVANAMKRESESNLFEQAVESGRNANQNGNRASVLIEILLNYKRTDFIFFQSVTFILKIL